MVKISFKNPFENLNLKNRVKDIVKNELIVKQKKLDKLQNEIDDLIENGIMERLQLPLSSFQEIVNTFINDYAFEYIQDKEMFINQIYFEENDDELLINIRAKEKTKNHKNKFNKSFLKVTIDDDKIVHELKTTDTFIETLKLFSLEKVIKLNLVFLGVPLIAKYRHEKYQQKQISDDTYVLTQVSKEKKVEILEFIAKKFNHKIKIEFVK
jgi:hypothetical protein